ncbi:MAG: UDP-2,4-diacetamido-2,4,6-trideoxy-beta-L-altropyranose hydrolase [Devosia marina]|uniref:UDP-2,4-diacetamido-2,4, 6-trideoxy-beta-L-altropyranose hydrolase n=1 Tax=Devosia marina TaxID=2683198 RepID=UPI0032EC3C93
MKVLFRADASLAIGTGHIMRCLTLARHLSTRGSSATFICREHPGNLISFLRTSGFPVQSLPVTGHVDANGPSHAAWLGGYGTEDAAAISALPESKADWIVVDHYGLDRRFERAMADAGMRVAVIDDLADRPHQCSLLLDQTFGRLALAYEARVPKSTRLLLGSRYALLRPEFAAAADDSLQRRRNDPTIRHIMVTLGGVDLDNVTQRVLDALDALPLPPGCTIHVVMGATAPWFDAVSERARNMRHTTSVLRAVSNMAGLMSDMDLAIGAAGSTAWERCCLGLPSLMVVLAKNQEVIAQNLGKSGAAISLGHHYDGDFVSRLGQGVLDLLDSPDRLRAMSEAAAKVTDGLGAARMAQAMMELAAA